MTNLESIKSLVLGYPVDENTYLRILTDRGIDPAGVYAGRNKAFELATADMFVALITAANVGEGGMAISMTDKSNFIKVASGLYEKHGEYNPIAERQPTVQGGSPW